MHRFYIAPVKRDRRHTLYSVTYNGQTVIPQTYLPSAHGCGYLASQGLTGRAEMWDHERPYARMIFPDLVKAGRMTVKEDGSPRVMIDRTPAQVPLHAGSCGGMMSDTRAA